MASVSMAMQLSASMKRPSSPPSPNAFFKLQPLQVKKPNLLFTNSRRSSVVKVEASMKEKAVAVITALTLTIPEAALAADSMTPSLKNFLLSIGAGSVVLGVIAGAIVGVSNFDPVKRS